MPANLEAECRCFTQHLLGQQPSTYVVEQYRAFHERTGASEVGLPLIESFLLWIGRLHRFGTFLADTYASRFLKTGVLRRKLILLLGLCESSPPHADYIDSADGRNFTLWVRFVFSAITVAAALCVSLLLFLPVHFVSRAREV